MKASELMIGDWVMVRDYPTMPLRLQIKPEHFVRSLVEFEPIPLTSEILEKNGFTKDKEIDQWYFKSNERLDMGLLAVGIDDGCGTGFCVMKNGAITYFCRYVHELQLHLRSIGGAKEIEL